MFVLQTKAKTHSESVGNKQDFLGHRTTKFEGTKYTNMHSNIKFLLFLVLRHEVLFIAGWNI